MPIRHYFTPFSPFAYLAGDRLERIAAARGVAIDHRPVDFAAVLAEVGGLPVHKRHPFRQAYRLQELTRLSASLGLPLNLHPAHWPGDARPASVALIRARAGGADIGPLSRRMMRGVWAEERDLADPAVVAEALAAEGLDPALASADPPGVDAAAEYARLTAAALEDGVFGAPFYVCDDGERFWGQDRLALLDAHLARLAA